MELGNGNVFELALDHILQTALLQGNTVFLGNRGVLDERGHARVRVDTAYLKRARNLEIFYSVVLLEEGQPYGVCRVSKPQRLWLRAR